MNSNLPALLMAYNRPDKTRNALRSIYESGIRELYVSVDGPKNLLDSNLTKQVVALIQSQSHLFNSVKIQISESNLGCKAGCLLALDWFFSQVRFGIIVEDDVEITSDFVAFVSFFCNQEDSNIWHINGWSLFQIYGGSDIYYESSYGHVWGWATWANKWNQLSRDRRDIPISSITNLHNKGIWYSLTDETDTWDYFWLLSIEAGQGTIISPKNRLTTNIGFDDEATHKRLRSWKQDQVPIKISFKKNVFVISTKLLDQLFEILYLREFSKITVKNYFINLEIFSTVKLLTKIFFIYIYEKIVNIYLSIKNLSFPI